LAPCELADEGKELNFCRCLTEVLLPDLPKLVLVSLVFLLFTFTVADVAEIDEISEDELPRRSCKCGGVEKLLHFPALIKKKFLRYSPTTYITELQSYSYLSFYIIESSFQTLDIHNKVIKVLKRDKTS
jgi:hypothetical protein